MFEKVILVLIFLSVLSFKLGLFHFVSFLFTYFYLFVYIFFAIEAWKKNRYVRGGNANKLQRFFSFSFYSFMFMRFQYTSFKLKNKKHYQTM